MLLEYDPDVISPSKVSDVLATHGYILRANGAEAETGDRWADKLASAIRDWAISALAELLALAMISALARRWSGSCH